MKLGHVVLDGTKIKANASKHKAMSYKRMNEEEARLEADVAELLKEAEAVDEKEDQRYGKGKKGVPKELAFREKKNRTQLGKSGIYIWIVTVGITQH